MSYLPVMTVDNADDVLDFHDLHPIIRIDGDLPTLILRDYCSDERCDDPYCTFAEMRPLREGDRVTLATKVTAPGSFKPLPGDYPFAKATVTKITRTVHVSGKNRYFVTFTDVEEL